MPYSDIKAMDDDEVFEAYEAMIMINNELNGK